MHLCRIFFLLSTLLLATLFRAVPLLAGQAVFDHSKWDQFLKANVNEDGQVRFSAVKADPALLNDYLADLDKAAAGYEPQNWPLNGWPREEQLAFWLNAYHAGVVLRVLREYPVKSINDISGVWTTPTLTIGPRHFSLNDIRNRELLTAFRDEKIHLALSNASRGGPPFPREAFTAPKVEGQLFMLTQQRVADPVFVRADYKKKRVYLSKIFFWYGDDFILDFGTQPSETVKFTPPDMAVLSFIRHYSQDVDLIEFLENLQFKVKFQTYDWTLADWKESAGAK